MSKIKTVKAQKARTDRKRRVQRTAQQMAIVAFTSIYPTLIQVSDLNALQAAIPTLGFIVFGALVTDIYNRINPA